MCPSGSDGKEFVCSAGDPRFDPWISKIPWRRKWPHTPVLLPGKSYGRLQAAVHGVARVRYDLATKPPPPL